jgi:hypothetical protein
MWMQLLTSAIPHTAVRESDIREIIVGSCGVEISIRLVQAG